MNFVATREQRCCVVWISLRYCSGEWREGKKEERERENNGLAYFYLLYIITCSPNNKHVAWHGMVETDILKMCNST